MNRFFPGRKDDSDDLGELDPLAHPVTPPRPAGATKVVVAVEDVEAPGKAVGGDKAETVAAAVAAGIEPEEPVPGGLYRAGAVEALKGQRLRLSPAQRKAQREAAAAAKLPGKDA